MEVAASGACPSGAGAEAFQGAVRNREVANAEKRVGDTLCRETEIPKINIAALATNCSPGRTPMQLVHVRQEMDWDDSASPQRFYH